ncbi:Nn.00g056940.m01.CDS01 [Neocucurbitaria sp. VM-36]
MNINDFPYEVLSKILEEVAKANIRDGPTYTFGLSQAPLPLQRATLQRYVRGPVPPELLKWDATSALRSVCWKWHEWSLEHSLKDLYIRRWKGGERWAELSNRRESYPLYELIDRPTGTAVYRDPFASLKRTVSICHDFPQVASKVKRMWVHGFYTAETDRLVFESLKKCNNLTSLSLPWTTIRHLDAQSWRTILMGSGRPLESLELQCVDPTSQQAADKENQVDLEPLQSANFSQLRRLKIFGDTTFMPVTDNDLFAIARTATQLEEFHLTCNSSITIDGVMAIVKASRKTLRVLEHSPRSQDGFWHPHPGSPSDSEHLCETFRNCPKLETLSISLPSVCADIFSNEDVKFAGDLQVRALHLCKHEDGRSTQEATDALEKLLQQARRLINRRAESTIPRELYIEIFFADCIFEPGFESVHGDFSLGQISSDGHWPQNISFSGKGPYGSTGLYEKEEEGPFQRIDEAEFLVGVRRRLHSIQT